MNITYHDSIEAFFEATNGEYYLLTKFGKRLIVILIFQIMTKILLHFGKETTGLPDWVKEKYQDTALRIL